MSATPNLGLPYIDAGQAQKHVTHNEALRALDTLVQLAVQGRDLTAPPVSPAEGERWIVKAGATDAWASRDNQIAAWQDGAWQFSVPVTGWIAYIADEEILVAWDGAAWSAIGGGSGGAREALAANRTYYVRTDGSDSNNGLANTAGGAFLTVQKAIDIIAALDIGTYNVTIQCADGTYTGEILVNGAWLGSGTVTLQGNLANPENVIVTSVSPVSLGTITVQNYGRLTVCGFEVRGGTNANGLNASSGGAITLGGVMRFGACASAHIRAVLFGQITGNLAGLGGAYSIVGGATRHLTASPGGYINLANIAITVTGTLAFSSAFAFTDRLGAIQTINVQFFGSATGKRYQADSNGYIHTNGSGANFFPGDVAGATTTGALYL